jgi:predicted nucleotidyltransferase component of viral defense system
MRLSSEKLAIEAESTGFRQDVLEKIAHLLGLLNTLQSHPFLKGKLVLKGGTALNLFIFDIPRLSVDIDLNYIGAISRNAMLAERPKIEQAVQDVINREGFSVRRMPEEHAGCKWLLRYKNISGQSSNLGVDINFMYRIPLWPITTIDSYPLVTWKATGIPVMDIHELVGGKLVALLSRHKARDLFDSHRILHIDNLDFKRIRTAFVVYGAMNRKDWRTISLDDVAFDSAELVSQLAPMLRHNTILRTAEARDYGKKLMKECQQALRAVLPFSSAEQKFLDLLLEKGKINPMLLTSDTKLQNRIQQQPLLEWKALNVRQHKRLS